MTPKIKARISAINNGIVPEGYKKTKVGIVPVEWETKKLREVLYKVSNGVEVKNDTLYQQIGIRSHGKGIFYKEKVFGSELGNKSVFWVEPDCFVLNIVFAWEQAIGRTTKKEIGMIASHRFPMFKPSGIDVDYVVLYLLTKRGTILLDLASPGGAGRNRTLGQDAFLNSKVILPPLPEQQKIAEILSTQDKLIELQEKKIEQLKELKKGYLQKMFPKKGSKYPELRFKGFTDAWEQRKLGDICPTFLDGDWIESKDQSDSGVRLIQTGNIGVGTYIEKEDRAKWVSEDTFNRLHCEEVFAGDILISRLPEPAGRACIVPETGLKMITAVDVTIARTSDDYDSNFILQFLCSDNYFKAVGNTLSGSTRQRISRSNLEQIPVPIAPTMQEQEQVGTFFSRLDSLITLHQRKLEQEKQKKKALMQLLLTGKVRVKI